jgi:hypothetical protein
MRHPHHAFGVEPQSRVNECYVCGETPFPLTPMSSIPGGFTDYEQVHGRGRGVCTACQTVFAEKVYRSNCYVWDAAQGLRATDAEGFLRAVASLSNPFFASTASAGVIKMHHLVYCRVQQATDNVYIDRRPYPRQDVLRAACELARWYRGEGTNTTVPRSVLVDGSYDPRSLDKLGTTFEEIELSLEPYRRTGVLAAVARFVKHHGSNL